jgi:hypothetical protein
MPMVTGYSVKKQLVYDRMLLLVVIRKFYDEKGEDRHRLEEIT